MDELEERQGKVDGGEAGRVWARGRTRLSPVLSTGYGDGRARAA
jgi:hypothetical protein